MTRQAGSVKPCSRRSALKTLTTFAAGTLAIEGTARAQSIPDLDTRIQGIINRPEFQGSRWGMEFYSLKTGNPVYSLQSDQLFVAASTAKIFIAATAFATMGPDYRFRTRIYRTGPVETGVLQGDLVLVASGDLFISSRVQPDGSLAVPVPDHSYYTVASAEPIPGDPLTVLRQIAREVAAYGIQRIDGRVLVDTSLFKQGMENLGIGSALVPVSPIMVNDNLVDIPVTPGASPGEPGVLAFSPDSNYLWVVDGVRTVAASDAANAIALSFSEPIAYPDGTRAVTLNGDIPIGQHLFRAFYVPEPIRFAEAAFAQALRDAGVSATADLLASPDNASFFAHYRPENKVAVHVSPPLSEEMKVMLKVSSNIHTVMYPYLIGAIAGHDPVSAKATGEAFKGELFAKAGLNAGLADASRYSPDSFVRFLRYAAQQNYFREHREAMAILGRDGDLAGTQTKALRLERRSKLVQFSAA